jgi:hypothetical protein
MPLRIRQLGTERNYRLVGRQLIIDGVRVLGLALQPLVESIGAARYCGSPSNLNAAKEHMYREARFGHPSQLVDATLRPDVPIEEGGRVGAAQFEEGANDEGVGMLSSSLPFDSAAVKASAYS